MTEHRLHWLEKLAVQVATLGGLAVVYFVLWRLARQPDPLHPVTFMATGAPGSLLALAGLLLGLSVACAIVTVAARPTGALLAALLGLGGVSLRSASIESLLWERQGALGGMYAEMILELLVLGAIVLAGVVVIAAVRACVASVLPGCLWRPRRAASPAAADATDPADAAADAGVPPAPKGLGASLRAVLDLPSSRGRFVSDGGWGARLRCLALGGVIAAGMVPLLMRSPDRGQIIFALLASFTVGSLLAHWAFPSRCAGLAWVVPIVVGIGYCVFGAVRAVEGEWMEVASQAQALPIDWITAGGGGAVLGYWISERVQEAGLIEEAARQAEGE